MKSTILFLTCLLAATATFACSMCKVTINGRTYLGNNEDSWRLGSRIWFEPGSDGKSGALYVGYEDYFPQGGLNEAGLAFDGLTVYPQTVHIDPDKKNAANASLFIREIMQTCATVEDVQRFAGRYNRQVLRTGVLLFADKSGKYLVLEPDTMMIGQNDKYIIANYCPSNTEETDRLKFNRYRRGDTFIVQHLADTSANYCLALVDTMHECRPGLGDGTLYSFVADLQAGNITLYFYHDYQHAVTFNLQNELAKNKHEYSIPELFPANSEYQKLVNYSIPQNSGGITVFLLFCGALAAFSICYFLYRLVAAIIKKHSVNRTYVFTCTLALVISALIPFYIYILYANSSIFYFPAPYHLDGQTWLNLAAYLPFLLIASTAFFAWATFKNLKRTGRSTWFDWIMAVNVLTYTVLIVLCGYWGLFHI